MTEVTVVSRVCLREISAMQEDIRILQAQARAAKRFSVDHEWKDQMWWSTYTITFETDAT